MAQPIPAQNRLLLGIIILIGFVGGFIYSSQIGVSVPVIQPFDAKDDLFKLKDLKIDFSALSNQRIQNLKVFGESPVQPVNTGKADIFQVAP